MFLFIVLNLLGVFFHECWRDELQAVLIANASSSPWDLISRTSRYEATPVLWHLILYFISFGKVLPLIVKLLNSFFIIGAASLFWFHFPVSRLLKTLLLFNYFFLYEYGLVARPYSMGIFLVFFYLSYRNAKNSKLKGAAVISLGLSCLSSLYASFVAIPLLIMRSFELYKSASKRSLLYEVVCFSVFFFYKHYANDPSCG